MSSEIEEFKRILDRKIKYLLLIILILTCIIYSACGIKSNLDGDSKDLMSLTGTKIDLFTVDLNEVKETEKRSFSNPLGIDGLPPSPDATTNVYFIRDELIQNDLKEFRQVPVIEGNKKFFYTGKKGKYNIIGDSDGAFLAAPETTKNYFVIGDKDRSKVLSNKDSINNSHDNLAGLSIFTELREDSKFLGEVCYASNRTRGEHEVLNPGRTLTLSRYYRVNDRFVRVNYSIDYYSSSGNKYHSVVIKDYEENDLLIIKYLSSDKKLLQEEVQNEFKTILDGRVDIQEGNNNKRFTEMLLENVTKYNLEKEPIVEDFVYNLKYHIDSYENTD